VTVEGVPTEGPESRGQHSAHLRCGKVLPVRLGPRKRRKPFHDGEHDRGHVVCHQDRVGIIVDAPVTVVEGQQDRAGRHCPASLQEGVQGFQVYEAVTQPEHPLNQFLEFPRAQNIRVVGLPGRHLVEGQYHHARHRGGRRAPFGRPPEQKAKEDTRQ
jgi:hypothetical protein